LGTQLDISIDFHSQTDGQFERTIQVLDDMVQACVIDFDARWDHHFPLEDFSYNKRYHYIIQIALFEALYCTHCRSLISWFNSAEMESLETDLLRDDIEKVRVI